MGRYDMTDRDPYRPAPRRAFSPIPRIEDFQPTEEQRQAQIWAQIAQMAASAPRMQGGRKTIHLGLGRALTGLAALNAAQKTQGQVDPKLRYQDAWKRAEFEREMAQYQDESERRAAAETRANKGLEYEGMRIENEKARIANSATDKSRSPYEDWRENKIKAGETPDPAEWEEAIGNIRGKNKQEFRIMPQPPQPREPPTSIQEYNYAKENAGYKGSYTDWIKYKAEETRKPEVPKPPVMDPITKAKFDARFKRFTATPDPNDPATTSLGGAELMPEEEKELEIIQTEGQRDQMRRAAGAARVPPATRIPAAKPPSVYGKGAPLSDKPNENMPGNPKPPAPDPKTLGTPRWGKGPDGVVRKYTQDGRPWPGE